MRYRVLAAAALFIRAVALAEGADRAALDAILQEAMKTWQVPGAAIAVVKGDEVVYSKGFGERKLGSGTPVTTETLFAIGSTSKAFTTTAMAMLVDDGKMAWDDPVRQHLEYFRLSDPLADQNVTLRDLVSHRTGLSRHDALWYGSPWSREEIIRRIGLVKLTQPYRAVWQYQNIMFLTAGQAIGAASKGTWEEFVQKRIFDPLGITGANFSVTVAQKAPDHATPHRKTRDGKRESIPWRNIDNVAPAGSINAGVGDLSKWLRFQLGDGTFQSKRLVSARQFEETHTPQMVMRIEGPGARELARETETTQQSYGLAWIIQDYRGHLLIEHGGGIDGFVTSVALYPKAKLGIAVVSNLSPASLPLVVRNSVADQMLGLPKKDWNAIFGGMQKQGEARQLKARQEREAKRKKDTRPSLELAAYSGAYEEPAYGTARVGLENGALHLEWSNFKGRLEHYHFDTFDVRGFGGSQEDTQPVVFHLGADGEVANMELMGQTFRRAQRAGDLTGTRSPGRAGRR